MNATDYYRSYIRATARKADLWYFALGLAGESGEAVDAIKKMYRVHGDERPASEAEATAIALELGDALWYLVAVADRLGFDLAEIMQMNMDKLDARRRNGEAGRANG